MNSIYDMDQKTRDYISQLNEKIDEKQKIIFDILLELTQGIKNNNIDVERKKELFEKISSLKEEIRNDSNIVKEIKRNPRLIKKYNNFEEDNITNEEEPKTEEKSDAIINTIGELSKSLQEMDTLKSIKNNSEENENVVNANKKKRRGNLNDEISDDVEDKVQKEDNSNESMNQMIMIDENSLAYKIKKLFCKFESLIKKSN